jgi:hypothetical protein
MSALDHSRQASLIGSVSHQGFPCQYATATHNGHTPNFLSALCPLSKINFSHRRQSFNGRIVAFVVWTGNEKSTSPICPDF